MARQRRPPRPSDDARRDLLAWVEGQLDRTGWSYAEVGRRTGYDRSWVSRALSGRRVPPWPLVEAIATQCGGDTDAVRQRWEAARATDIAARRERASRQTDGRPPAELRHYGDLVVALHELLTRRNLSHRELVRQDETGVLRDSTVGAVLRQTRSAPRHVLVAMVQACGVPPEAVEAWAREWDRLGYPYRQAADDRRRDAAYASVYGRWPAGPRRRSDARRLPW